MDHDDFQPKYEDTLQCFFFSTKNLSTADWERLCESINATITSISRDYIWHRDEIITVLPIFSKVKNDMPNHLISTTCFGDNIEDEWFIVYLILELTKVYNHLIVQLEDNDGDFLLIEAADYLPPWANPKTTENRVFIFNQHLHLIPQTEASTDSPLKLIDAINLVSQKPEQTKASLEIEKAIIKRISEYPQKVRECQKAILTLPIEIATILTLKPSLISPIVNMYCSLDVLDAKHCKDIKFEDCIDVEVRFTKYLYAMLMQSKLPTYVKCNITKKDKKSQLGLKVTTAYKVIMSRLSRDICCTPEYRKFLDSLIKNGYFKNNLEGSREYSKLLEKAKTYFFDMECSVSLHVCNTVNELKSSNEFNNTSILLKQKSDSSLLEEDDDNWLNVSPEQLNEFLNNQYGKNINIKNSDPITPQTLISQLTDFLKQTSDFEGIEHSKEDTEDNSIDFNSEDFVKCLEKMLNIVSNQNDIDSDFSSDGEDSNLENNNVDLKAQDLELASKLKSNEKDEIEVCVLKNFTESVKTEGASGPASIMLRQIGLRKNDILDSDDDDI